MAPCHCTDQGAIDANSPSNEKGRFNMVSPRPPKDDEPGRPDDDFLPSKTLLLLIIAVVTAALCIYNPRIGAAVVGAFTVLALLWKMTS